MENIVLETIKNALSNYECNEEFAALMNSVISVYETYTEYKAVKASANPREKDARISALKYRITAAAMAGDFEQCKAINAEIAAIEKDFAENVGKNLDRLELACHDADEAFGIAIKAIRGSRKVSSGESKPRTTGWYVDFLKEHPQSTMSQIAKYGVEKGYLTPDDQCKTKAVNRAATSVCESNGFVKEIIIRDGKEVTVWSVAA